MDQPSSLCTELSMAPHCPKGIKPLSLSGPQAAHTWALCTVLSHLSILPGNWSTLPSLDEIKHLPSLYSGHFKWFNSLDPHSNLCKEYGYHLYFRDENGHLRGEVSCPRSQSLDWSQGSGSWTHPCNPSPTGSLRPSPLFPSSPCSQGAYLPRIPIPPLSAETLMPVQPTRLPRSPSRHIECWWCLTCSSQGVGYPWLVLGPLVHLF